MSSLVKQEQQKEDVYSNFVNSIKSDVTKKVYEYNLRLFMEFCGINKFEDLIGRQNQIITYLMSLREKKLSYNSISTRLNAIYHFYDMNDVFLNKKKIKMFKGEYTRKVVDRAYTHEEISKMLDVSDLRAKTIILLMASSGIRIGSLPDIRIRNLKKINNIYKVTVYEGSNSQYFTFCILNALLTLMLILILEPKTVKISTRILTLSETSLISRIWSKLEIKVKACR